VIYLAFGAGQGWARVTTRNAVDALRAFFRFGAEQGWGPPHLAAAIEGPRGYALEGLPAGPTWAEVERLFAGLDPTCRADVRDRAILMLFAIYGLRESEVAKLRLDTRRRGGGITPCYCSFTTVARVLTRRPI
jgi:integrase/recombinase XerD